MPDVTQNDAPSAARKPPVAKPPVPAPLAADTIEWAEPMPVRSGKTSLAVAITASLLAIGLGYTTGDQWRARQNAETTLGKAHAQLQALNQENARISLSLSEHKTQLAQLTQRLEQTAGERGDLATKLGAAEARLNELEVQSEAQAEHLAEFRALTKQFQRMIDSGKLQINFRRGRMIVELPAAVLFASGSAELSGGGRQSLAEIAKILRKVPGKRFVVAGHTDDVPIAKGSSEFGSNWSLSAARAVKVTESLIDDGMRANHLVAAGYGEYDPIASNANDHGRQKNRRIEIVLEPELGALPEAIAELKKKNEPTTNAGAKAGAAKPKH